MNPRCSLFSYSRRSVLLLTLSSALRTRSFAFLSTTSIQVHSGRSARPRSFLGGVGRAIWTRGGSLDSHSDLTMEPQQTMIGAGEKLSRMRKTMKEWGVDGEFYNREEIQKFRAVCVLVPWAHFSPIVLKLSTTRHMHAHSVSSPLG